jgi:hypothetical protein
LSYAALGGAALTLMTSACYFVVSKHTVQYEEALLPLAAPLVEEPTYVRAREPEPTRIAHLDRLQTLAFVVEKTGQHAGRVHRLGERTVVGRSNDCDIVLDDEEVSRQHTSIRLQDNRFAIRDLDSANGTWLVNGDQSVRVESPYALSEHDRIRVGSTVLVFTQIGDKASSGDEHR